MVATSLQKLVLRAELLRDGRKIVAHTTEISESAVFVQTDETGYTGDSIIVELSFPGLVEPFRITAELDEEQLASGPGKAGGWWLKFVFSGEEEKESLSSLLAGQVVGEGTYSVLLVEDNEMTRDVFSYGVEKFFRGKDTVVRVDIAEDAEKAWTMLGDGAYDLAIVDYYLPALNGDQLIARVRADDRFSELPVVAISVGGSEAREVTLAAGADLFLEKPVVIRDLFATLERLTAGRASSA